MNRYVRLVVALAAIAAYLVALRFVAPSDQPYFILGIGIVGLVAWLLGTVPGLVVALLLIPLTNHVYRQFTVSTSYLSFAASPAYLGIQILAAVTLGRLRREKINLKEKEEELAEINMRLQGALSQVQELGGIHNLCSECKAIQDDDGKWQSIGVYLKEQTKMEFSHCICPSYADNFHKQMKSGPSA
jgi:ethanolamine transporter EutH